MDTTAATTNAISSRFETRWLFELISPDGAVAGGGWVAAPTEAGARTHARLFLAGLNDVRIVGLAVAP